MAQKFLDMLFCQPTSWRRMSFIKQTPLRGVKAPICGRLFIFKPCAHKRSVPLPPKVWLFFFLFPFLHLYIWKAADCHIPNQGLQNLQPWQELEISAQNHSLCYKTTFSPLMKILSFAAALTKCSFGGFVLADILGFVPFKQHESVLDIEQELDGICKWIKASQFTSIWSTSI